MQPEVPSPHDPRVRAMRRLFLAVVTGSVLFLIPWIAYLSASLPSRQWSTTWRLAWVGFDGALIAALGVTALCAWRRLQLFIPWAMVSATLLGCDAWFDIMLDWNSDELTGAVLTALLAELPLAALLLYVARRMIRFTVVIAWRRAGRTGPVPPLSRLSLIVLDEDEQCRFDDPDAHPAPRPQATPHTGHPSYTDRTPRGAHRAAGPADAPGTDTDDDRDGASP